MIRVMVVDDHPIMAEAAGQAIEAETADLRMVGHCDHGDDVLGTAERTDPDVIVMNINMPGANGIEVTRRLRAARPGTAVLIWTVMPPDPWATRAREAGARGFITKQATLDDFLEAVRTVAGGGEYWLDERRSRGTSH